MTEGNGHRQKPPTEGLVTLVPEGAEPTEGASVEPGEAEGRRLPGPVAAVTELAVGMTALVTEEILQALPRPRPSEPSGPALLFGATLAVGIRAGHAIARAADVAVAAAEPVIGAIVDPPFAQNAESRISSAARELDQEWRERRADAEAAARAVLDTLVPRITDALVDRLDLTALARDRIDLDAIVAGIDLDAIVSRIDVQQIADRIDVNAIVARVDVDAVLDRLDLSAITLEVLDDIDLPEVIRSSTDVVAGEGVRTVRMQSAHADNALSRLVGRVLGRSDDAGRDDRSSE